MELPKEIREAGVSLRQRLQHHLGLRAAVLGQQDLAEPSFADDLQDVELVDQVHLFQETVSFPRGAAHDFEVIDGLADNEALEETLRFALSGHDEDVTR